MGNLFGTNQILVSSQLTSVRPPSNNSCRWTPQSVLPSCYEIANQWQPTPNGLTAQIWKEWLTILVRMPAHKTATFRKALFYVEVTTTYRWLLSPDKPIQSRAVGKTKAIPNPTPILCRSVRQSIAPQREIKLSSQRPQEHKWTGFSEQQLPSAMICSNQHDMPL